MTSSGASQDSIGEGEDVCAPDSPNCLDVLYRHEPETATTNRSLPTKFYRPAPSLPRSVSDRLFAIGTKSNMQSFKLALVVEGLGR